MTPLEFLRDAPVRALLERAARCAGAPLSLHFVERNQESPKTAAWGGCAACQYVAGLLGGKRACRQSRLTAASTALRQQRPVPFLCHMGFACVAAPVLPGQGFVLTFGPYCPAGDESKSLEFDALNGLAALTEESAAHFPTTLDDIHRAPANCVPAVAEWTVEALRELWHRAGETAAAPETEATEAPSPAKVRKRRAPAAPQGAADIALALAGGNLAHARGLLHCAVQEAQTHSRIRIGVRRGRLLAVVSAAIEAAEAAGLSTGPVWNAFPVFVGQVSGARGDRELTDAGMALLGLLSVQQESAATGFAEFNRAVISRLGENITLDEVARQLGQTPSAITHRLQRKFGMSFSEYVGRLRVDKAKELLRRTRLSVGEIGRRVGVNDQSNFGKLFARLEGRTPGEYREQLKRKS